MKQIVWPAIFRQSTRNAGICIGIGLLAGCGSGTPAASVAVATPTQSMLKCDDSLKTGFTPDANTSVLLVKAFKRGEVLSLESAPQATTPIAGKDVCVVKLLVGPGNPGPSGAPSTSPGIGIEVWLPAPANWNDRIHVKGGGGWAGTTETSLTQLAGTVSRGAGTLRPMDVALDEGAVSASTDTGHVGSSRDAGFAMRPDGTINNALWTDFAERSLHEMAVKTKALARAYYGRDARYAYWDGASTGGRQGLKEAQAHPGDFDGILAGYPAVNWTRFITGELYPQLVYQRDLDGVNLTKAQLDLMSNAAINGCGVVGGIKLGYIPDPMQCTYDPRRDANVLCSGQQGLGVLGTRQESDCVSLVQATAMNKIWYGQTIDGSVPDPTIDNGSGITLAPGQQWYGPTRGTTAMGVAGTAAFPIATEMVALELQDPLLASTLFKNATGNGTEQWKKLSYADLARAGERGIALQSEFGVINTDNADLSAYRNRGGKILMYHGLADELIPAQGSIHYYNRVAATLGGIASIQNFYRFYLVPGMAHSFTNGTSNPDANPPLPDNAQLYSALTDWVEKGIAPGTLIATATATASSGPKSRPLCLYPLKATYQTGDPNTSTSYACQ